MQTALSHYQTFQISEHYKIPSSLHNLLDQAWHSSYEELYEESTADKISLEELYIKILNAFENNNFDSLHYRYLSMAMIMGQAVVPTIKAYLPNDTSSQKVYQYIDNCLENKINLASCQIKIIINQLFPHESEGNQAIDEALDVFKNLLRVLNFEEAKEALLNIIDDCLEGYAIFPGSQGKRDLFNWWLLEVIPAAWCLQFPKTLYTIKGIQDTKNIQERLYNRWLIDSESNKTNDLEAHTKSSEECIMEDDTGCRVRNLLENFQVISTYTQMAIVPAGASYSELIQNVKTAVAATSLGLTSLDYTRKAYVENIETSEEIETSLDKEYKRAYFLAKNYVHEARKRLITSESDHPTVGVFGASLVLERLESTLFSAHLLYSLGNVYEGHAVSRVMLEQMAWAYEASAVNDCEAISNIKPNQAISKLKKFLPKVGKLYGHLSKHTHIDYHRHHEFIKIENNQNMVLLGQDRLDECTMVILHLADIFVAVWEFSQRDYLKEFTAIDVRDNSVYLLDNRAFLVEMKSILNNLIIIETQMDSES